jgi:gas vesicle protein
MFNKKRSPFRSFAITFGIGAAVGAAVALLYAPMTGKRMQRKVADATEKVKNVVEDSVDNVQNVLRKVANA